MVFSSLIFLVVFLPVVLLVYYGILRKRRTMQNVWLFLMSLLFYAWGEPVFVIIMVLSILANWIFGILVDRHRADKRRSRLVLALAAVFNLTVIFIFKYLTFVLSNLNLLFQDAFSVPEIALPIGISFFTFQGISYVIDVYRENGEVQKNPLNVGLYIAFFPQLIAGPIVRYETVARQIKERKESTELFSRGVIRFLQGLSKKVILANNMGLLATSVFQADLDALSMGNAWIGALAYSFQILFDFSGYSDMAIGLGLMFGFEFLENFNYPYISSSISEFWRRWHISLGSWFRDYVYFPLGGSRVEKKSRLVFNLFVVWTLTGVWHGANWTFILWGVLYFLLIALEKLSGFGKITQIPVVGHIYTLFFVQIGWVLFNSPSIESAISYLQVMFGMGGGPFWDSAAVFNFWEYGAFFAFSLFFSIPVLPWAKEKFQKMQASKWNNGMGNGQGEQSWSKKALSGCFSAGYVLFYMLLFFVSMGYMVKASYNPFIYFNF